MNRIGGVAACLIAAMFGPAVAQEKVKLKLAGFTGPAHFVSVNTDKVWMAKVGELTGGRVTFEYYPAQQLGKAEALMALAMSGVADVGQIALSYVGDKLPVSSGLMELSGLTTTSCSGTAAFDNLSKPGGELFETEFKPNQLRPLFSIVLPPANMFTLSRRIDGPASFAGLKLRVEGGVKAVAAEALGAVPVQMASPDAYQALSRGTIDGVSFNYLSVKPYKLETLTKYGTAGFGFGATTVTYGMSEARWSTLPADVQDALVKAGEFTIRHFCQYVDKAEQAERGKLQSAGMTITPLPPAARQELRDKLKDVGTRWAIDLDQRGGHASDVLAKTTAYLAAFDEAAWLSAGN